MPVSYAPLIGAPLYAPPLAAPVAAPGVSGVVPFIRRPPAIAPIRAPLPPVLPPLPPLTVAPASPAAGGLLRAAPLGAALLGAAALGLAVGNAIYEDGLNRPFGPSLGDLFFPDGQPLALAPPEPVLVGMPLGQCLTDYNIRGTVTQYYFGSVSDPNKAVSSNYGVGGPIHRIYISSNNKSVLVDHSNIIGESIFTAVNSALTIDNLRDIQIIRRDGLPDDCAVYVPSPLPEPIALPRPTLPQPGEARPQPQRLPLLPPQRVPLLPPQRVPRLPPGEETEPQPEEGFEPQRLPQPVDRPFAAPNPLPPPLPETEPETERNPDGTPRTPSVPPTPALECCPSLERKLDEVLEREPPEECDLTGVEELLQEVLEKLAGQGGGAIDLTPCFAEEPVSIGYQGAGLIGVYSAIAAIAQSLNLIHADTKCPPDDCVAAVPDWWQMRPGANRPQLSVIFRKGGGQNYHAINIPHPKVEPRPTTTPIGPYTAGNFQATIVLIDNSKFIVNADTAAEANRVALEAAAAIKPIMLGSELKISITERRGYPVSVDVMDPRYMQYFPEGQQSRMPAWRVSFR